MSQLDKTFPTLDCSACILTPKMVEASANEKIHLYTYSEVEKVSASWAISPWTSARRRAASICLSAIRLRRLPGEMSFQKDPERIQPRLEHEKRYLYPVRTGNPERPGHRP